MQDSESTALQTFDFQGNSLRIVEQDGGQWWVAKDICNVLGFSNPSDATKYLDDDEVALISNPSLTNNPNGQVTIVNEFGLYALILRSRKPEAKAFRRWVTHEVLPAIRKTGTYTMPTRNNSTDLVALRGACEGLTNGLADLRESQREQNVKVDILMDTLNYGKVFTVEGFLATMGLHKPQIVAKAKEEVKATFETRGLKLLDIDGKIGFRSVHIPVAKQAIFRAVSESLPA